ncbi:hypothetical protein WM34_16370 [Burkholderia ubonensis]|uniref:hypothetical protein n=1 Tax=Burkholderia ubonensis TaxID=101571 RepID=UPI00076D8B87|nr:hypothetical protein [Burkholderia ubonensis]KVH79036.1 hypothetical protein WJ41_34160 [Burkholderia ubonensis]KVO33185.1 hypothetical protein WJ74_17960 [Burkholderia ubonensis]KVU01449.1 hypothetical protein WK61_05445 [Burkholderia ubonensis]KWC01955.1 hypothetical protein WL44_27980 [Burkholderia ubonensis]KWO94289.1 hypothetical protein WM34_16370 [Burkholderia ubonensis]
METEDGSRRDNGKKIEFELSPEDLKAIASGKAVQISSAKFFGKTTFTIENAPIPKSIKDAVTIRLEIDEKKSKGGQ